MKNEPKIILDYHQPDTPRARRIQTFGKKITFAALAANCFDLAYLNHMGDPDWGFCLLGSWLLWIVIISSLLWRIFWCSARHDARNAFAWYWIVLFIACVMWMFVLPMGVYDCPHGTNYYIRFICVTYSDCGGPCRNWFPFQRVATHHLWGNWYIRFNSGLLPW